MKKIILAAIMMLSVSNLCFAQLLKTPPAAGAVHKKVSVPPAAQAAAMSSSEVMGKVKSVSMAGANKAASLVIIDSMGKEAVLTVLPTTLILKEGKATTLDKVTSSMSVRVKYKETQGVKAALAIQVAG